MNREGGATQRPGRAAGPVGGNRWAPWPTGRGQRRTARLRVMPPLSGQLPGYWSGWTFVEVIVVIAIILILGGTVGLLTFSYIGKANVAAARTQIETYSLALNSYAFDNGFFPSESQGFQALWKKPEGLPEPKNWSRPYVEKEPADDPWGNAYKYMNPGPNQLPFGIVSYGADGQEGGTGDAADIASWE